MTDNRVGQGGYSGDITIECFGSSQELIPFAGTDPLTSNVRMGVYEASGFNGKTGKAVRNGAFIHKISGSEDNSNKIGHFYGFGEYQMVINIQEKENIGKNLKKSQIFT